MSVPGGIDRAEWIRAAMERHESDLLRYAQSLTGDPDRARDVVQDTFLRLCGQEPGSVDGHLAQWLFTVCRNRVHDVHRKESRMSPLADFEMETRESPEPNPAARAADRDTADTVRLLLEALPANQREVVRLKFQAQMSYEEIAAVTSLSIGNVGFLLHTAIKTLRKRLAAIEHPPARPTSGTARA
jgi:RNA polymerase sigma-70 factor (ECF subfamily)